MSQMSDFEIVKGSTHDPKAIVLEKYVGTDEQVVVPDSVTEIGFGAFLSCRNLKSVEIPDGIKDLDCRFFPDNGRTLVDENGFCRVGKFLIKYVGDAEAITIPEGVAILAFLSLAENRKLKKVYLPSTIEVLGNQCLRGCRALEEIVFPENCDCFTEIEYAALQDCANLTRINLPDSVRLVDSSAFSGCSKLFSASKFNVVGSALIKYTADERIVIGVKHQNECKLNPNPELILSEGDRLILIAQDDGVSQPEENISRIQQDWIRNNRERYKMTATQDLLILGSNDLLPIILDELDVFLPSGSQVTLALDSNNDNGYIEEKIRPFNNLILDTQIINMTNRHDLEIILTKEFEHILILSNTDLPIEDADAKTLAILLHIRDIVAKNKLRLSITSEMLDVRNQELAQGTIVTDFVIGSKIASLIMAQVSENRLLADIFCELLQADGSEFYLKPASHYISVGQPVNLYTVVHAVSLRNEVFIGYKQIVEKSTGETEIKIITNPDKNIEVRFSDKDWLIVLSED